MTKMSLLFVLLGLPTAARAEPISYLGELQSCRPSCYSLSPPKEQEQARTICGYQDYSFSQVALGGGRWSTLESDGTPLADPTELKVCKLPKAAGGKWTAILAQARKEFPGMEKGDVLTVEKGEDFSTEKVMLENSAGRAVLTERRSISIRLYSKTYELRPNDCGSTNPNVVCEFSSEGRGGALGFNQAEYRLDEAKKLKATNDKVGCQTAAWNVVGTSRAIDKLREVRKKENKWPATRRFKTRNAGTLDEATLFAKLHAMSAEAATVFAACGGADKDLVDAYDSTVGP